MVKNDVRFILLFVILMEKYGFFGSPLECAQQNRVIWCARNNQESDAASKIKKKDSKRNKDDFRPQFNHRN